MDFTLIYYDYGVTSATIHSYPPVYFIFIKMKFDIIRYASIGGVMANVSADFDVYSSGNHPTFLNEFNASLAYTGANNAFAVSTDIRYQRLCVPGEEVRL